MTANSNDLFSLQQCGSGVGAASIVIQRELQIANENEGLGAPKKKKKKKKSGNNSASVNGSQVNEGAVKVAGGTAVRVEVSQSPPLKISRNKHMKYISAYHGPWLQLPLELMQSLLAFNNSPDPSSTSPFRIALNNEFGRPSSGSLASPNASAYFDRDRNIRSRALREIVRDPILASYASNSALARNHTSFVPPPVDPAVFSAVTEVRKLVEEATALAIKASSSLSVNFDSNSGGGRNLTLSHARQHRLRLLAVSKLAVAYRIDEIAASVAIMQGSSALDDLAERVLKTDPSNTDARYVHFFHEKIPSQTLAASTNTEVLDQLIIENPHQLEYYRTLGVVNGFKQDYKSAIRNFTQALLQAKAARRAKQWRANDAGKSNRKKSKLPNNFAESDGDQQLVLAGKEGFIGLTPGDDIERQLLFLRGMAYFHFASSTIEEAVLSVERAPKPHNGLSNETGEPGLETLGIRLPHLQKGLYGCATSTKAEEYRTRLRDPAFLKKVMTLLSKSLRDHERFLSYFPVSEVPPGSVYEDDKRLNHPRANERSLTFRGRRLIHYRCLTGRTKQSPPRADGLNPEPALLTAYHPLLIESHFTVVLCKLLLGDFSSLIHQHTRVTRLMENLESQPVFLPARSLSQSEYAELMERLAVVWLPDREAAGQTVPEGSEHDMALEGPLACLHFLVSFFTKEYSEVLEQQAKIAEREAKEESKAKANASGLLSLLDVCYKPTESNGKNSNGEKKRQSRELDPPLNTTARSEMALAWLTASVIPMLQMAEKEGVLLHSGGRMDDDDLD
ncbi:hypothetical protein BT69DRAFT_1243877 [Atractiella rhizophila]|nr:hypothetical protein BT69DRAFT_1243877 [Atractiella rhizophila]